MAKYTRVHHAPARPSFVAVALNYLSYLALFAVCGAMLFLAWPMIQAQIGGMPQVAPLTQPTALVVRPQAAPAPFSAPALPQAAPLPGIAQNAATAQAMYNAAVQAAEPQPNVNVTNDPAPVIVQSKPIDRHPAGENVPTAEPIVENSGIFGSKPVIVAPQETHECKHGQVWIDGKGCKNP